MITGDLHGGVKAFSVVKCDDSVNDARCTSYGGHDVGGQRDRTVGSKVASDTEGVLNHDSGWRIFNRQSAERAVVFTLFMVVPVLKCREQSEAQCLGNHDAGCVKEGT